MHCAVARFQRCPLGLVEFAESVFDGFGGKLWIQPRQRCAQPSGQHNLRIIGAFGVGRVRRNVRAIERRPAEFSQPFERGFFHDGFGEIAHVMFDPGGAAVTIELVCGVGRSGFGSYLSKS
jgi:hypothetical protein